MRAISFANQKGGVGKSTLCASLAVTAGDSLILDVDPQASVSQWFQSRPETLSLPECMRRRESRPQERRRCAAAGGVKGCQW
jgi:cellulose biosynthesis protein BcsQ